MENIGYLAVVLGFTLAIYSIIAGIAGRLTRNAFLEVSAQRGVMTTWALTTVASGVLLAAILLDDFRLNYVASYSSIDQPLLYQFSAWWGGQEGSLLFWAWIAATYSFVAVYTSRKRHADMISYVIAILMSVVAFFLGIVAFVANPFTVLMSGPQIATLGDGNGLNPLLQHPMMAVHPPILYLGYVGFVVPFAFAIASVITKQPGDEWIRTTRVWSMVTWGFQSLGVLLGMRWAYVVLGWGGYWMWDPVENASLLPWITGTAFLHSVMMQEKKGMMKIWNIVLVSATFFLCMFGTMLTRSGLVSSVHAFAQSNIGDYFVWFLTIGIGGTIYLILSRLDFLKSESKLDSVLSRESSFLFNNVILLASCFAILWGTLFPVISEAVTGEKISVGAAFFNRVNIPIGLLLLLLTGLGPLFSWRKTSAASLKKNFLWPAILGVTVGAVLMAFGMRNLYALMTFMLSAFVTATVAVEFYRGARVIARKQAMGFAAALVELTHRNTRRYGGYLVHMGIVFLFIGFAGLAFTETAQLEMRIGETMRLGKYELALKDLVDTEGPNYVSSTAVFDLMRDGEVITEMRPEQRIFMAGQQPQPTGIPALRTRLNEDVYVVLSGFERESRNPIIKAYINPLVMWVWIGGLTLVFGTLVALWPSKVKRLQPRTKVKGKVSKSLKEPHAATTNT